jgi:hypothetical protein
MVRSNRTSAKVIAFPANDKPDKPPASGWVFRLVENNEDLVAALGVILDSYRSVIAGKPVCNTAVISQVEIILRNAKDVKWNAIP